MLQADVQLSAPYNFYMVAPDLIILPLFWNMWAIYQVWVAMLYDGCHWINHSTWIHGWLQISSWLALTRPSHNRRILHSVNGSHISKRREYYIWNLVCDMTIAMFVYVCGVSHGVCRMFSSKFFSRITDIDMITVSDLFLISDSGFDV